MGRGNIARLREAVFDIIHIMAEVVIQDCLYRAVMKASRELRRPFDEAGRQRLFAIIEENGTYPPERWRDLPDLLESLKPFEAFGLDNRGERFRVFPGEPVIVGRRTASVTRPNEGHAIFGYANEQMLWGDVGMLIVFKR